MADKTTNPSVPTQPLSAKIGEVKFRRKLMRYFFHQGIAPGPVPTLNQQYDLCRKRLNQTLGYYRELRRRHILRSPFLDVGAGTGTSSLPRVNNYRLDGFALGIADSSLVIAEHEARTRGYRRLPNRICGAL